MTTVLRTAAVAVALIILLQACSTAPRRASDETAAAALYEARYETLSERGSWALKARVAVSDGDRGGSGSLNWSVDGKTVRMDFHGALGRGAWSLRADEGSARLELADGSAYQAPTVMELARQYLDWPIPVDALSWWVRGLQAPGDVETRELGEDGMPVVLKQQGWRIEFDRYALVNGATLPVRFASSQGKRRVKFVVREWQWGDESD